ncbi:hypothetical protein U0X36_06360 [Bacillus thuringiensis]|uniref:hypothetical protein n=1 Tax=Bacillus thuringiensis TaxID=1428 RepID=UPI000E50654D|nr:hypothetical protein [Bacillus thuringiensis]MDZ3952556.1 hypothetical protein [Bacillus thuringiensis]RGP54240.1 hypothetical protein BTW32_09095 [Bacillus thuringiensis]
MRSNWKSNPISELGDQIGKAIMLTCKENAYIGGLKDITEKFIMIEVGEGMVIAVDRTVLNDESIELHVVGG